MINIILASQSPRRKQLLEQAEISFQTKTVHTNEDFPADMDVALVPLYIARHKALAVKQSLNDAEKKQSLIIAADTVVVLDNQIIGKPGDEADAIHILSRLSGRRHEVITGAFLLLDQQEVSISETTAVYFNELSEEQISHYVHRYQPFDKAGAYAIQEWIGLIGIQKIEGDFYNVMGLPVNKVLKAIAQLKD